MLCIHGQLAQSDLNTEWMTKITTFGYHCTYIHVSLASSVSNLL